MHTPDDIPELATVEQRLGAFLIDSILSGGVVVAAFAFSAWCSNGELWFNDSGGLFGFIPTLLVLLLGWSIFVIDKVGSTGQTPGKSMVGIKVIPMKPIIAGEEAQLGFGRAFAREIVGKNILGSLTLGIGLLAPLFTEYRQGLQDKLTETVVVKSDKYEAWIRQARQAAREKRLLLEQERISLESQQRWLEDERRWHTYKERELERMMDDHRSHREGVNRLRHEWGIIETDDEKRERIHTEKRDEHELRKRFARAMGLIETDDGEREARERRVRERHEQRERERIARKRKQSEDEAREIRERRVRERHEQRERERIAQRRRQSEDEAREIRERRVRELHEQRERDKVRRGRT